MLSKTAFKTWLAASEALVTVDSLQAFANRVSQEKVSMSRVNYRRADIGCITQRGFHSSHRAAAQHELQVLVPAVRKARSLVSRLKLIGFEVRPGDKLELHRHLLSYLTKTPVEALDGPTARVRLNKVRHQYLGFTATHQRTAFALLTEFPELFAPVPEALATPESQLKSRLHRKLQATCELTPEEGALLDRLFASKIV